MIGGIGINPAQTDTEPQFRLGSVFWHNDPEDGGQAWMYVKAAEAITGAGYLCVVDTGFAVEMVDTTSSAPGAGQSRPCGAAGAAIAQNSYGWIQIYGKGSLRTLASAAVGTMLNSTATPGAVDDDGSSGAENIFGLSLGTATGVSEATNTDAFFNFPFVGNTVPS